MIKVCPEDKIIEENGKKYKVIECPGCGAELKFHLESGERRVHCMCAKCGRVLEVCVPALKK